MSFRPWAKAERKEWLPEEGPYVILADIPPGKPSVLKPDLTKCLSIKTMKDSKNQNVDVRARMVTTNGSRGGTEGQPMEPAKS